MPCSGSNTLYALLHHEDNALQFFETSETVYRKKHLACQRTLISTVAVALLVNNS